MPVAKFGSSVGKIMKIKKIPTWAKPKFILGTLGLTVLVALLFLFWTGTPSPVPVNIKNQLNFAVIYPKGYSVDSSSWNYQTSQKILAFIVKKDNYTVAFTEQMTPLAYQNDVAAYNRFIGSLRPSANFNVPLGTVSLANFVTTGDYQPTGPSGILNANGTMLIAHPSRDLSGEEWRNLFESLSVDN